MITIKLHNLGKVYEGKGKTLENAINNIEIPLVRGHGVLVVSDGERSKERILNARIINGNFGVASPTFKRIALKNIISLFSEFE